MGRTCSGTSIGYRPTTARDAPYIADDVFDRQGSVKIQRGAFFHVTPTPSKVVPLAYRQGREASCKVATCVQGLSTPASISRRWGGSGPTSPQNGGQGERRQAEAPCALLAVPSLIRQSLVCCSPSKYLCVVFLDVYSCCREAWHPHRSRTFQQVRCPTHKERRRRLPVSG